MTPYVKGKVQELTDFIREIRDKYLTSSLLWDIGLLDEAAEKIPAE